MDHFNFSPYVRPNADTVLLQVYNGTYGLLQSGQFVQRLLKDHLANYEYVVSQLILCYFYLLLTQLSLCW